MVHKSHQQTQKYVSPSVQFAPGMGGTAAGRWTVEEKALNAALAARMPFQSCYTVDGNLVGSMKPPQLRSTIDDLYNTLLKERRDAALIIADYERRLKA